MAGEGLSRLRRACKDIRPFAPLPVVLLRITEPLEPDELSGANEEDVFQYQVDPVAQIEITSNKAHRFFPHGFQPVSLYRAALENLFTS